MERGVTCSERTELHEQLRLAHSSGTWARTIYLVSPGWSKEVHLVRLSPCHSFWACSEYGSGRADVWPCD
eukprot:1156978-Pelagomonas_calceolata.AAC.1